MEPNLVPQPKVRLEVSALGVINYALQQNIPSAIHSVLIHNESDAPLENTELRITSTPALCLPYSKHFACIGPGASFHAGAIELKLSGEFLAMLTERTEGFFHIQLVQGDALLCQENLSVAALAYDQWHGYSIHPELLSAFVTPNHPEIVKLTARGADFLEKWTGDPSLDGYQTQDPNRALQLAAAMYAAIQEQNIVYCVPPASFEEAGQRVRLCDSVLGQKMATCLDITLLYAACLEAVGLHPLLILQPGHIFAGIWLEDLSFPEAVQDDVSLITKRLASGIGQIAVVECTAMNAGKNMDFDAACRAAEAKLTGNQGIECIIDVARARLSGVRPIPLRIATEGGFRILRPQIEEKDLTAAPQALADAVITDGIAPQVLTKKDQWERKLLDLGMRNALINMRLSRSVIPLLTTSVDALENALNSGRDFSIHPRPADYHVSGSITFESIRDLQSQQEVLDSEFKNRRLRSACTETELAKTLKDLYRAGKTSLEENGANTLYLALDLLRWYETDRSTKARYAPLVLLPVEMVRRSASQGYVIRLRDEDAQMNITMLEKLKQDFKLVISGLDPLPEDEFGIDIRRVFTIVRQAIMNQSRWDVLETAFLGIFSFSQFVMWNDIRNRSDDLSRNKIVRSLMDGKLCWEAQDMSIGDKVPQTGVYLPMAADASQLFAIHAGAKEESFVLHGPPGTGKSQTITTLIANALAQGKSVLFVAEKMAALEVVQKRLTKIGIGNFCLELHSNKAKKRNVLEQLRAATEVTRDTAPGEYAARAEQMAELRAELDSYASALHAPTSMGESLFTLVCRYEENSDGPELPPFSREFVKKLTAGDISRHTLLLEQMVAAAKALGHPHGHPLESVCCTQYSQSIRYALPEAIDSYRSAIGALKPALEAFRDISGCSGSTRREIETTAAVAHVLSSWLTLPRSWAKEESPEVLLTETARMAEHLSAAREIKQQLLTAFKPEFLTQDGAALCRQWDEAAAKWFLGKLMSQSGMVKKARVYALADVNKENIRSYYEQLAQYQTEQSAGEALFLRYGSGLAHLYRGEDTDYAAVSAAVETALAGVKTLDSLGAANVRMALAGDTAHSAVIEDLCNAYRQFCDARQSLYTLLSLSGEDSAADYLGWQEALCTQLELNSGELKDYIAWNATAEEAAAAGLGNVVDAYRGGADHDAIVKAYRKALYKALAMDAIDSSEALSIFSGAVFNEKVRQFKVLDSELMKLTQQEIFCRLAAKVPSFAKEAAHSSELGILQRAIRSGGRGISIRKLFQQLPNLLPRLCPCMLMSPISAAQYLDPKRAPFDLVVFDEASQLPTAKAVGALARGKNAIIVGDPKQMPPTAFFISNTVDEENLEAEDLESILDDCLALNIPQTHLLWHYRSRHESLIAFSNARFYENRLYTFPSVNDRISKVTLKHVDGVFERSKRRQNRAEAEAIVAELKRRCHDEKACLQSVGVVTFNISQQHLIDDLLYEACREDPALDAWAFRSEEPVFIKNLENVQGDERDVILFSVGYGPDEHGKVYMNFGPLNRDGGWRRLNVAITRSRQEMMVFSTLRPEQIDLSRTSSEGVAALKAFLEYAKSQKLPQNEHSQRSLPEKTGIAQSICAFLKEKGYNTATAVGHSEYRIDIGVIDPKDPQQYRLGILLDGSSYGAAKTTRDREMAQIGVLEGLGWQIARVWTMDWWDNPQREKDRLLKLLQEPVKKEQEPQAQLPELPQSPVLASAVAPRREESHLYAPAPISQSVITAEEFLLPRHQPGIKKKIISVIDREAPISKALLIRRIVQSYGITRAGSKIQAHLDGILSGMGLLQTSAGGEIFLWKQEQDPDTYRLYRCSAAEEDRREPDEIPVQEAAAALQQALADQLNLSREDLLREGAKLLGYPRMGTAITALMLQGMEYSLWKQEITTDPNGNYILTSL